MITIAKNTRNIAFKNCQISYVDNTITEFTKDGINVYSLSNILDEFGSDEQFIDVTFRENYEIEPESQEG